MALRGHFFKLPLPPPGQVQISPRLDQQIHRVLLSGRSEDELHALLQTVITRLMKMLTCRAVLIQGMGLTWLVEPNPGADGDEAHASGAGQLARKPTVNIESQVWQLLYGMDEFIGQNETAGVADGFIGAAEEPTFRVTQSLPVQPPITIGSGANKRLGAMRRNFCKHA